MSNIDEITKRITAFRDARDWKQFHNPKDMAISLLLESSELLEHFQWKDKEEAENHSVNNKSEIAEELSDILYWVLLISNDLNIDILDALDKKMLKNEAKYPEDKSRGNHKKYTEL